MAINKARMQVKRGNESDFDPSQMLPGEWAVSLDTKYVRMCFAPGICVRMATYDAFEADMEEIRDILLEAQTIQEAVARIQTEINDTAVVVEDYSVLSKSYAVGGTGKRENEDSDNAKYYYEQTKQISQGINGIVPMGTVAFADLPTANIVNNAMYNVSDAFTSDVRFNDGGGIYYGPGNNVIWTAEGKWDVTASSSVTGIKGSAESAYRVGNVNITPTNIGLGNVDNTSDADKPISTAQQAAFDAINGSLATDVVPSGTTSIIGLIGLVAENATKTYYTYGSILTDFPTVLANLSASNLVLITIQKATTFSYVKINACVADGTNYSVEGLYNGTALFWSEGDAVLRSSLAEEYAEVPCDVNNNPIRCFRSGKIVRIMNGGTITATLTAGTGYKLGTIPEKFRPQYTVAKNIVYRSGLNDVTATGYLEITSVGDVNFIPYEVPTTGGTIRFDETFI